MTKTPFNLEEEIDLWRQEHGVPTTPTSGKEYYLIKYQERERLLVILVNTIKNFGADKEYFSLGSVKDKIGVGCCGKQNQLRDTRKWKRSIESTMNDLRRAVAKVYGTDSQRYKEHGIIPVEMANKEDSLVDSVFRQLDKEDKEALEKLESEPEIKKAKEVNSSSFTKKEREEFVSNSTTKIESPWKTSKETDELLGWEE